VKKYNLHKAKSSLPELVRLALEGEDSIVARNGEPLVRRSPYYAPGALRPVGLHRLPREEVSADFLAESIRPLKSDELRAWEAPLLDDPA
jgi:antitoxin (DNA-binding transcriptional repressor) of toxin-antitoxin stability system